MSFALIQKVNDEQKKAGVVNARSGDTVRVHQKIKEGTKERVQIFEGVVIRTDNKSQHTSRITVRKVASGVGVEKGFLLHSPTILKVEIVRRAKVRRNYLSYLRGLAGKRARLTGVNFDRDAVNTVETEKVTEEVVAAEAEVKAEPETTAVADKENEA